MLLQIGSGCPNGLRQRAGKVAWVEAVLVEKEKCQTAGLKSGSEVLYLRGTQGADSRRRRMMCSLERLPGADGDLLAGKTADIRKEFGIKREAEGRQLAQRGRVLGIASGQHSRRRPGGFRHRAAALEDGNLHPSARQLKSSG